MSIEKFSSDVLAAFVQSFHDARWLDVYRLFGKMFKFGIRWNLRVLLFLAIKVCTSDRPTEVDLLIGDYTKAKEKLGWEPRTSFEDLVHIMVTADLGAEGVADRIG